VNYLGDNKNWNEDEEENLNWERIEVSRVDDKIIEKLLNNLKTNISDDFFISFESLLKLGKKIEFHIKAVIDKLPENLELSKDLFEFVLNHIENKNLEYVLVPQLFHPDFITRARAIMTIDKLNDLKYLKFIVPLIEDPDASVRWTVINLLINNNQIKDPLIHKKLKNHMVNESNEVILERLKRLLG
jgi:spore coat polysaccharide biosynthesis protein SpsF (cytidylyltransferase family)